MASLLQTDQPGRVLAVFLLAPILVVKGIRYADPFISVFAVVLMCWDFYWLVSSPPRTTTQQQAVCPGSHAANET